MTFRCLRCGATWFPNYKHQGLFNPKRPVRCAVCRSPLWNKPKKNRPGQGRPAHRK